jgi:adenylate cyclase
MKLTSLWTCVTVILVLIGIRIYDPDIVEQIRLINFDYYQKSQETTQSESVVLLDIGEQSLDIKGQWPFPRQEFAQMISDLRNSNAGMIGFTIMFPEQDRFGGDEVFASWVKDNGIILAQTTSNQVRNKVTHGNKVGIAVLGDAEPASFAYKYPNIVRNIATFEENAWGIGMVTSSPEVDGAVRRIPLVVQVEDQLYPSFGLEVVRVMSDKMSYTLKVEPTGIENMRIPPYEPVKTDYTGSVWIDWSSEFKKYEYGEPLPDLQGKTVIVGLTAEGLQPLVSTPNGLKLPHEIQASLIHTLTGGKQISRPQWTTLAEITTILVVSLIILLSVYFLPIWLSALTFLASISGVVIAAYYGWTSYGILIDFSYALLCCILVFSHSSFNNFYIQFKLKQQIKGQFGTYLSPDMVDMLVKDPSLMRLGGDRKEMTFLFMDICGFTPISEHYKNNDDPEGLVDLVNEFLDAMTTIILNNGGTIDKYMGDCIMAFWNAPLPCENHAEMAVKSAIEIEEKTNELKRIYKDRNLPDINVGTGINTGTCIVGNMGSKSRFDYSVIGDAVNLAARLEATAARHEYIDYKTIISSFTYDQLPDSYICSDIGTIKVKGKDEEITIYSPKKLDTAGTLLI